LFLGLGMKHLYSERGAWVAFCLAGISIFVFDLVTLALVAMWGSLRSLKANQAGAGITAIVRVCIVPWFLFGAFGAFMAVLDEVFHIHPFTESSSIPYILVGVWFLISVANDVLLATSSLNNLRTHFRAVATERAQKRIGLWGRWLAKTRGTRKVTAP
jgi:hypothetical protein